MDISQKLISGRGTDRRTWIESLCVRPEIVVQIVLPLLPSKVSMGEVGGTTSIAILRYKLYHLSICEQSHGASLKVCCLKHDVTMSASFFWVSLWLVMELMIATRSFSHPQFTRIDD